MKSITVDLVIRPANSSDVRSSPEFGAGGRVDDVGAGGSSCSSEEEEVGALSAAVRPSFEARDSSGSASDISVRMSSPPISSP